MTNPKHHENMTTTTLDNLSSYITTKGVDTLMLSKLLRKFDFSEAQAEVVSELIKQTNDTAAKNINETFLFNEEEMEVDLSKLPSKNDLALTEKKLELQIEKVRSNLEIKIESVRSNLEIKIESVKYDLIKWVAGLMLAQVGLVFSLIKIFTNF